MTKTVREIELPAMTAGTRRFLRALRYRGPRTRPKAYIQASIHADEVPPLLVAHHLERALDVLDAAGRIQGEVVLVPFANPIGLAQFWLDHHHGRFEAQAGQNFNRGYPAVAERVAESVAAKLGGDPAWNTAVIRKAALAALADVAPVEESQALKLELMKLSLDADLVLDLHCDFEALVHVYLGTPLWPDGRDLAAEVGARVTLLSADSGGAAFDEANSRLWWELAQRFPERPIPPACFAATLELRGERDVSDEHAAADADALVRFLARRRVLTAPVAATLPRLRGGAVPLEAVDVVEAPAGGVLVWRVGLGESVAAGDVLGEIVNPEGTGARVPVTARGAGLVFARRGHRWVRPGQMVAKIAGREPLPWRKAGALLFD